MFESYLAPADGVTPHRDLASLEVWEISLQRSQRRRALAEQHRRAAPRTKGAATAVTRRAARHAGAAVRIRRAAAPARRARSAQSQPLVRSLEGRVLKRGSTRRGSSPRSSACSASPTTASSGRSRRARCARFQRGAGLAATGRVDARTRSALLRQPGGDGAQAAPRRPARRRCAAPLRGHARRRLRRRARPRRRRRRWRRSARRCAPPPAGRSTFAGTEGGYGKMVCVRHSPAFVTCYAHLSADRARPRARRSPPGRSSAASA